MCAEGLEGKTSHEFEDPHVGRRSGDVAEGRPREIAVWRCPVDMIERVVRIHTELESNQFVDWKRLGQRSIEIDESRPVERISSGVTVRVRSRQGKCTSVDASNR